MLTFDFSLHDSKYYELGLTEALQINQEIGIELPQQCVMLHLMPQIVSIC